MANNKTNVTYSVLQYTNNSDKKADYKNICFFVEGKDSVTVYPFWTMDELNSFLSEEHKPLIMDILLSTQEMNSLNDIDKIDMDKDVFIITDPFTAQHVKDTNKFLEKRKSVLRNYLYMCCTSTHHNLKYNYCTYCGASVTELKEEV